MTSASIALTALLLAVLFTSLPAHARKVVSTQSAHESPPSRASDENPRRLLDEVPQPDPPVRAKPYRRPVPAAALKAGMMASGVAAALVAAGIGLLVAGILTGFSPLTSALTPLSLGALVAAGLIAGAYVDDDPNDQLLAGFAAVGIAYAAAGPATTLFVTLGMLSGIVGGMYLHSALPQEPAQGSQSEWDGLYLPFVGGLTGAAVGLIGGAAVAAGVGAGGAVWAFEDDSE